MQFVTGGRLGPGGIWHLVSGTRCGLALLPTFLLISTASAAPFTLPAAPSDPAGLVKKVAVFGADDRVELPLGRRPLARSIGLLYEQRSHSVCTAFCVGEATVATAGHCMYRTSGERAPRLTGFSFRLGGAKSTTITRIAGAASGAAAQNVTAGATSLSIHPPIDASRDWAFVRLQQPVCKGVTLPIKPRSSKELTALAAADRVYQVAYHRDFENWQLAYGAPCDIRRSFPNADWEAIAADFADPEHLVLHTCDTGGASSGSPLLVDGPNGPEVVGMNVGTYVQSKVLLQNGKVVHRYQADTVANTGVNAGAFFARLAAFDGVEIIASRARLVELQALLAERGFYKGPRDGTFGPLLKAAIESFETSEGRTPTGLATTLVLHKLIQERAQIAKAQTAGTAARIETGSVGSHQQTKAKTP